MMNRGICLRFISCNELVLDGISYHHEVELAVPWLVTGA